MNGKKVSGVLAEACWSAGGAASTHLHGVVLGMGVNVRTDFTETELERTAISLEPALGRRVDRLDLLVDLVERVDKWYRQVGTPELFEAWKGRLNMLGKRVAVEQGSIQGLAENVDVKGALLVRDKSGTLHRVLAGDIALGS
jgi:BirA family transcriptional regulator, biotin operon repressor / biotin---[acetyl-CoA-carboxylase] ligase